MFFSPVAINMLGFNINSNDHNSIISFGPNVQIDYFLAYKRNQGFGEQNGDLLTSPFLPVSGVNDPDFADADSVKNSFV